MGMMSVGLISVLAFVLGALYLVLCIWFFVRLPPDH